MVLCVRTPWGLKNAFLLLAIWPTKYMQYSHEGESRTYATPTNNTPIFTFPMALLLNDLLMQRRRWEQQGKGLDHL